MRKEILAGNWKMHKNALESVEFAQKLADRVVDLDDREVLICPTFVSLVDVKKVIEGTCIKIGAQNVYFENEGAFTGEISAGMLSAIGCDYVIVGHSERRTIFKEDDFLINKKLQSVLKNNMRPILCVGETLPEREEGILFAVVERQLRCGLLNVTEDDLEQIVIAYEPVWAIGTGKVATKEQAEEMHKHIRNYLSLLYDKTTADSIRIQYGGSVKPDNISELMNQENIDGALVGGASLDVESFSKIVLYNR